MTPELRTRLITGFSLAGVLIALLIGSYSNSWIKWSLLVLSFLVTCLGIYEYATMTMKAPPLIDSERRGYRSLLCLSLVSAPLVMLIVLSVPCVHITDFEGHAFKYLALYVTCIVLALVLLGVVSVVYGRQSLEVCKCMFRDGVGCLALVVVGGLGLMLLSVLPGAGAILFWYLLVICLNDVGAYFAGKQFGTTKLAPALSPNKTVNGALGGIGAGVIAGCSSFMLVPHVSSIFYSALLVILLVMTAQTGDLLQSCVKRIYGVKDSGAIFPGHGGVLDRLDGILFAAPVYVTWIYWTLI